MNPSRLFLPAAVLLAASFAGAQTAPERDPAGAPVGKLRAAEVVAGFSGTADEFGRRIDADGDLIIVADEFTAGVVSISEVAFEVGDLLASATIPNFTGVIDVALEGDRALVLVERSNGAEGGLLFHFRRVDVLGDPVWLAAGQADLVADSSFGGSSPGNFNGLVELRDGVGVVAFSVGTGNEEILIMSLYELTTSAVNFIAEQPVATGPATSLAVGTPQGFLGGDEFAIVVGAQDLFVGEIVVTFAASEAAQVVLLALVFAPAAPGTRFGESVAIDGNLVFVGEPGADVGGTDTGRVHVYDWQMSTLTPIATLTSPTPVDGDEFGHGLALNASADRLAIAERHNDAIVPTGSNGSGYVRFAVPTKSGAQPWELTHDVAAYSASSVGSIANLGADLSFAEDDTFVAGAPGTSSINGFVTWFFLPSAPYVEVEQSPALAGTPGLPELHLEGAVYEDAPIVVGVRNALPNSTTFVIIGVSTLFAPAKGGIVYPAFDVLRMFPTNAAGEFVVPTTWTADFAAAGPFDMHFQFWTLDPGGVAGFSATDGGVLHQY